MTVTQPLSQSFDIKAKLISTRELTQLGKPDYQKQTKILILRSQGVVGGIDQTITSKDGTTWCIIILHFILESTALQIVEKFNSGIFERFHFFDPIIKGFLASRLHLLHSRWRSQFLQVQTNNNKSEKQAMFVNFPKKVARIERINLAGKTV